MGEMDLSTITAANVVDARGVSCPGPLLEAKKGMGTVQVGQILEILSNDPGSRNDIPRWAKKVGHDYLGFLSVDGADRIFVKRNK
jgi:tRNA 2-thiouridine synthesizing protein A